MSLGGVSVFSHGRCESRPDSVALLQIIAFDELRTDFKSPIDQGNPVHAVSRGAGNRKVVSS